MEDNSIQSQSQSQPQSKDTNGIDNNVKKPGDVDYVENPELPAPPAAKYWKFKEQPSDRQRKAYKHEKTK